MPLKNSGIDFEKLISKKLVSLGWRVRTTERSGDGGIDLTAVYGDDSEFLIVQCKDFNSPVGPDPVRIIFAASHRFKLKTDIICAVVSKRGFTRAAHLEARQLNVILLTENELIEGCVLDRRTEALLDKERFEIEKNINDWNFYNKQYQLFIESREKARTAGLKAILIFTFLEIGTGLLLSNYLGSISLLNAFVSFALYKHLSFVPDEPDKPKNLNTQKASITRKSIEPEKLRQSSAAKLNSQSNTDFTALKIDSASIAQTNNSGHFFKEPLLCLNCKHSNYISVYHDFIKDRLFCEKCSNPLSSSFNKI